MIDILAQGTAAAIAIPVVSIGAIIGVYVWVSKHIANGKIHPEKKDIVFEKTCTMQHRLENKRSDERHKELTDTLKELKDLIRPK